jgi:hypothetical protein
MASEKMKMRRYEQPRVDFVRVASRLQIGLSKAFSEGLAAVCFL